jgi:Prokaryotic Cytochrome C oxidase subunit IV
MESTMDEKMLAKKKSAYQAGLTIFILLVALTIGEYALGVVATGWFAPLLGIAILKAFFVIRDYMHISRLFTAEEEINS